VKLTRVLGLGMLMRIAPTSRIAARLAIGLGRGATSEGRRSECAWVAVEVDAAVGRVRAQAPYTVWSSSVMIRAPEHTRSSGMERVTLIVLDEVGDGDFALKYCSTLSVPCVRCESRPT
jgi:hypothetical protein